MRIRVAKRVATAVHNFVERHQIPTRRKAIARVHRLICRRQWLPKSDPVAQQKFRDEIDAMVKAVSEMFQPLETIYATNPDHEPQNDQDADCQHRLSR